MEIIYSRKKQLTSIMASIFNYFASIMEKIMNTFEHSLVTNVNHGIKSTPGKILVMLADDDKDDREFFEEVVTEINSTIHVHGVKDGLELMEALNEKNKVLPDILFLDLNMPGKNGKECLKEIKNCSRLKDMPVVIYSTSSLGKDIRDTHSLGANLYISKPNNFNSAITMIKKVFSLDMENHKPNPHMRNYILSVDPQ